VILRQEKTTTDQGLFEGFDCFDSKAKTEKDSLLGSSMFCPSPPHRRPIRRKCHKNKY